MIRVCFHVEIRNDHGTHGTAQLCPGALHQIVDVNLPSLVANNFLPIHEWGFVVVGGMHIEGIQMAAESSDCRGRRKIS